MSKLPSKVEVDESLPCAEPGWTRGEMRFVIALLEADEGVLSHSPAVEHLSAFVISDSAELFPTLTVREPAESEALPLAS